MYRPHYLLWILLFLATALNAQKNVMSISWRDSTITIDGDSRDWEQPFRYYDSKSKVQYSFQNDREALYLCFKTIDEQAQLKMMRAGFDVWLDTTGKKKEVAGVHFPIRGDAKLDMVAPDPEHPMPKMERPDIKKLQRDYALALKEMKPQGLRGIANDYLAVTNGYGIQAAINWDRNQVFTYELKMPFKLFYRDSLAVIDTLRGISIGFKLRGMELPPLPSGNAGGSAANQNGISGSPNALGGGRNNSLQQSNIGAQSGMNGPPPSMGYSNMTDMGQTYQVWSKVRLASPPK